MHMGLLSLLLIPLINVSIHYKASLGLGMQLSGRVFPKHTY